ncbi:hypothetical protein KFL_002450160 [Klebsormidium nitens]|uniref:WW domain-containing protein n=1 Tax=Klebsormidium nitens TaxID=105231 RepID=A0A1Y1I550_KLENI|nr:hypothetical protein KFL_002450160 [Klebsormidium nitens]|eukprot:GAQ85623.1 hypothetical protein KFL_002450160 [Klebsormidium nitens]
MASSITATPLVFGRGTAAVRGILTPERCAPVTMPFAFFQKRSGKMLTAPSYYQRLGTRLQHLAAPRKRMTDLNSVERACIRPQQPLPEVQRPEGTVTAALSAVGFLALSCKFLPPLKPAFLTLSQASVLHVLLNLCAVYFGTKALRLVAFEPGTTEGVTLLVRSPGLPPDWHALFAPTANRPCYYNSVTHSFQWDPPASPPHSRVPPGTSTGLFGTLALLFNCIIQQLVGLVQPVVTLGLYWSRVVTFRWCVCAVFGANPQLHAGAILFLSAAFLSLPQPLPLCVLLLGRSGDSTFLGGPLAARLESFLCVAILVSALPGLCVTLMTFHRAAEERLPKCRLPWDFKGFLYLLLAICPALTWWLYPYAVDGPPSRVALLPLPSGDPFRVPVPRWEVLKFSWRALLSAAPMILPLARLLVAAAKAQGLSPGAIYTLVLCSRTVQLSACVSGLEFLLARHTATYKAALKQKMKDEDSTVSGVEHEATRGIRGQGSSGASSLQDAWHFI